MRKDAPKVVISVVNWNTPDATIACVRALLLQSYPNFEVVAVDNGSTDDSANRIRCALLPITILCNNSNGGFAAGHRTAVERSR